MAQKMSVIKKILELLKSHDKDEYNSLCDPAKPKSFLNDWKLQDTPYGCNGDLIADDKNVIVISHTNPIHTKATKSTWKENRVELAKVIPKTKYDWKFKVNFHKLATTSDWVIFSQLWNRTHDNVLSLVVQFSTKHKGKVKLRLDQKQNKQPKTLWSGYFDQHQLHDINLVVTPNSVTGSINGDNVGVHQLEVYTDKPQEIKYGLYWSGKIPFNNKNKMVVEYKF
jgi:hypothetical protein